MRAIFARARREHVDALWRAFRYSYCALRKFLELDAQEPPGGATYRVTWEIDIDARSARRAAEIARAIQLDPESAALVFRMETPDGGEDVVDLMAPKHG